MIRVKLKALLLIPAAFAGCFTVLAFHLPMRSAGELGIRLAVLGPVYFVTIAVLARMWCHPPGRRYLGHSRVTWSILLGLSYAAGAVSLPFIDLLAMMKII